VARWLSGVCAKELSPRRVLAGLGRESEDRMKVVLTKDVPKLGRRGEIASVADGYARNYLFPKGLALEATAASVRRFEGETQAVLRKTERVAAEAETAAGRLAGLSLTVRAKAGEEGRLFGSVTSKDIASGIKAVLGMEVDRRKIELPEPIKSLGSHRVTIRLSSRIVQDIVVCVEGQE
jgi:large subunit ribosomal protein L9